MPFKELFRHWSYRVFAPGALLRSKYDSFKKLLEDDRACLETMAELEELNAGQAAVDYARVLTLVRRLETSVKNLVEDLSAMKPGGYMELPEYLHKILFYLRLASRLDEPDFSPPYTLSMADAAGDVARTGGKASALALAARKTGLAVPMGFTITSSAFHYFMEYNELRPKLEILLAKVDLESPGFVADICHEIQRLILAGEIPPPVADEIRDRAMDMAGRRGGQVRLAVRSSAVGEDSAASFAGQYSSELNVSLSDLSRAYVKVLAGKYSPKAVSYRIRYGLSDQETPMAALVLEMIDATHSGVIYTADPGGDPKALTVYAVPGEGRRLVGGAASPEIISISRDGRITDRSEGGQAPQAVCGMGQAEDTCLSEDTALALADMALTLEKLFGEALDIEWCQDAQGIHLLQARPLRTGDMDAAEAKREITRDEPANELLLDDGIPASRGAATGKVCLAPMLPEIDSVPQDCVLVSETLSPAFASVLEKLAAVVTDTGSRASHFASVAREFGLPVIVDAKFATRVLTPGRMVTVDACRGRVYDGKAEGLRCQRRKARMEDSPFARRTASIMEHVSPLNLTDPDSESFKAQSCRTIHDVIRFCHERGVREMFSLVGKGGRGLAAARKLVSELPLSMYILDLESGLATGGGCDENVSPECFKSEPMRAVWNGLTHPSVQWKGSLPAFDWEEFDRVSGGIISTKSKLLSSYAVLSSDYLHMMIRFGYHFAVLDALGTDNEDSNYVNFRFKGGGAAPEQRTLRLNAVAEVLKNANFAVKIKGDMLDARCPRRPKAQIMQRLTLVGTLMGRTRLLDMALDNPEQAGAWANSFLDSLTDKQEA